MIKSRLSAIMAKVKVLAQKKPVVLIAAVLVIVGVSVAAVAAPSTIEKISRDRNSAEYQRELQDAVDTSTGAPQDGRDPASQSQNSLASAASKPDGPGQRTDQPAAKVSGDHDHHTGQSHTEGVTSAGCIVGYGDGGEQCLQTPGEDKTVTCEYVRSKKGFEHGIKVTGNDQYDLDKNNDGTACGHDE